MIRYDVAIVGAGPAGMAAAIEARHAGLSAILIDEQPAPGGQIYRAIESAPADRLAILGEDYAEGAGLVAAFRASGAVYLPGATVWNVNPSLILNYSRSGRSHGLVAGALVIATGAIERATPMPGWTLPGVMTAGACQILLKAEGLAEEDVVFVGSGPLVWLIAAQMVAAGRRPRAIVETVPLGRYVAALPKLRIGAATAGYLRKGFQMMRAVRRAGIPLFRDATDIAIEGGVRAEAVSFRSGGRRHRLETKLVALHQGVVPNQQMSRLLRCAHHWNDRQRCFVPTVDRFGETSLASAYVVGDSAGIGGARAAALQGRLAALRIAQRAGRADDAVIADVEARLRAERAIRPFLETLYAPSAEAIDPADETIVCRCEEISAGQIRNAVDTGISGPNQVKSFLRNGMGPCQGRICGLTVAEIIAARRNQPLATMDYYRVRPPLKPIDLAELAALTSEQAVPMTIEQAGSRASRPSR